MKVTVGKANLLRKTAHTIKTVIGGNHDRGRNLHTIFLKSNGGKNTTHSTAQASEKGGKRD